MMTNTNDLLFLDLSLICGGKGAPPKNSGPHHVKSTGTNLECVPDPGDVAAWAAGGAFAGISGGPPGIIAGALGGAIGAALSQAHAHCGPKKAV